MSELGEQAQAVVALHGVPLTPAIWDAVAAAFDGVLAPDLRNAVPADARELACRTATLQLATAEHLLPLLDESAAVHVIGHSFGGQVAIELGLLLGERLSSLTLICTRDTPFPGFMQTAAAVRAQGIPDARTTLARWFTPAELARDSAVVRYAATCLRDADPAEYADTLEAIAGYHPSRDVTKISAPVTVIAAGHDSVSPPQVMRVMADQWVKAEVIVVDEWAHMSPFASVDRLVPMLRTAMGG
ncbi:alpha/beta fold hydrolase [Microbacterium phyllosphaerae]